MSEQIKKKKKNLLVGASRVGGDQVLFIVIVAVVVATTTSALLSTSDASTGGRASEGVEAVRTGNSGSVRDGSGRRVCTTTATASARRGHTI
jgi:hypothetical protein